MGAEPRKTLVLQEVTEEMAKRMMEGGDREERAQWLAAADVALFMFDGSNKDSFAYAHKLLLEVVGALRVCVCVCVCVYVYVCVY
jgi:kynurenine formamidase